jgi:hypothetical protein
MELLAWQALQGSQTPTRGLEARGLEAQGLEATAKQRAHTTASLIASMIVSVIM